MFVFFFQFYQQNLALIERFRNPKALRFDAISYACQPTIDLCYFTSLLRRVYVHYASATDGTNASLLRSAICPSMLRLAKRDMSPYGDAIFRL